MLRPGDGDGVIQRSCWGCRPCAGVPRDRRVGAERRANPPSSAGADKLVIKAQVLAGGRGKGHFDGVNGLKGGVQMVDSCVPFLSGAPGARAC